MSTTIKKFLRTVRLFKLIFSKNTLNGSSDKDHNITKYLYLNAVVLNFLYKNVSYFHI